MTLPHRPPASPALRVEQLRLDLGRREPPPVTGEPAEPLPASREQRFWPAGGPTAPETSTDRDDPVDPISPGPHHD